ncbi:MAG TPA: hypothetical protein IAA98_15300 [Candidatus Avipropionibacterium avicola]|uniref:Uncharacterized protein n=1 Tax=Candidatus Avipropionibacterium avicola TaxID=2840701 RepID=A0A9D1GZZ8_9ACTN|nr:hypothetical protein [Candidatus Avipropionibacterium avicola]
MAELAANGGAVAGPLGGAAPNPDPAGGGEAFWDSLRSLKSQGFCSDIYLLRGWG